MHRRKLVFTIHCFKALFTCLMVHIAFVATAQDFRIVKVNTNHYPEIQATFQATVPGGERVFDAVPGDFKISENKENCRIIEVTNPSRITVPASVVLVFDISLSMSGNRLNLARKSAHDFIEQIPLETSEVAIASFSDQVYVNCDFTQNKDRLNEALGTLYSSGGTSYSKAFLNEYNGALALARSGKNRKFIVFLTDGLSNADAAEVIEKAKADHIAVFCITLELPIPGVLHDIALQTGGNFFQSVADYRQLSGIYSAIFQTMEISQYGTITWQAANDCKNSRHVSLSFRNTPVSLTYDIPPGSAGSLDIDPSLLSFGSVPAGITKNLSVDLIARHVPITVTDVKFQNKGLFFLSDSIRFPFLLEANHVQNIILGFKPENANVVTDKLIVSSRECPDKSMTVLGGSEEQLRLVCPRGGETLVVGADTSIRWEGVRKSRELGMSYRIFPDKTWKTIGEGSGWFSKWAVPFDTGSKVQVRLKPLQNREDEIFLSSTMSNQKNGVRNMFFNNDATMVITTDGPGAVKIWDTSSGRAVTTLDGFRATSAAFGSNDKKILLFTKDEILEWDTETSRLTGRQSSVRLIYTSLILPDGSEKWIPCHLLRDKANTVRLVFPGTSKSVILFDEGVIKQASLTPDGTKALLMDDQNVLKIWNSQTRSSVKCNYQPISAYAIIINPNGKTAVVLGAGTLTMIDTKQGNELFHVQHYQFVRYSISGDMILARNAQNSYTFLDSYTGRELLTAGDMVFYKFMPEGCKLLYYKNDSVYLLDVMQKRRLYAVHAPTVQDMVVSPEGKKFLIVYKSNVVDIFDAAVGKRINRLGDVDGHIRSAVFGPDASCINLLMDDYSMQYWSPMGKGHNSEVVSGYFSIISPQPLVKKVVRFDDQYVGTSSEKMIPDFIVNPSSFPVFIRKTHLLGNEQMGVEQVSGSDSSLLDPHGSREGEFRFSPPDTGEFRTSVLTCTATDTFLTQLSGRGVRKPFSISPSGINFGKMNIRMHKDSLVCLLKNESDKPLNISGIASVGPDKTQFFLLSGKNNYRILPGDSLMAEIRFAPIYRGKTSGCLAITVQGVRSLQPFYLNGEGVALRRVWVTGRTLNSNDSTPVSANVSCTDLVSGNKMQKQTTTSEGKFKFPLNADRNYGLSGEKSGFLSFSENIDIREATLTDTIKRNIFLTPLKTGAMIRLNCIFFEFAKAALLDISKSELNRIAEELKQYPHMLIEVRGHTDSIGSDASNLLLSKQRAGAVRSYLMSSGIPQERLTIRAFGESVPVSSNSTEEGRQMNRRVELKILNM